MNWILERAKMWVGGLLPAVAIAVIKYTETSMGVDIPTEIEVAIVGGLTAKFVHDVPNKSSAAS